MSDPKHFQPARLAVALSWRLEISAVVEEVLSLCKILNEGASSNDRPF